MVFLVRIHDLRTLCLVKLLSCDHDSDMPGIRQISWDIALYPEVIRTWNIVVLPTLLSPIITHLILVGGTFVILLYK